MSNSILKTTINTVTSSFEAIGQTTNGIAKIKDIQRRTGVTKKQSQRLLCESETNTAIALAYSKFCQENPGIIYEATVGNIKLSNINNVLKYAAQELDKNEQVPDVDFDEEWLLKFFNTCGETFDLEKQQMLARVLSGKLRRPNSVSYRALNVLKNLTKDEILLFKKVASLSLNNSSLFLIPRKDNSNGIITYGETMRLAEYGILDPSDVKSLQINKDCNLFTLNSNYFVRIEKQNEKEYNLPCYYFTLAATELIPFIQQEEELEKLKKQIVLMKDSNINISLYKITNKSADGTITYELNNLLD